MKTLTITLADETAARFAEHAAENGKSAQEWAARLIEQACDDDDWFEQLPPEDRAAIEEGLAQADRGEFATDAEMDEVFARFDR